MDINRIPVQLLLVNKLATLSAVTVPPSIQIVFCGVLLESLCVVLLYNFRLLLLVVEIHVVEIYK